MSNTVWRRGYLSVEFSATDERVEISLDLALNLRVASRRDLTFWETESGRFGIDRVELEDELRRQGWVQIAG